MRVEVRFGSRVLEGTIVLVKPGSASVEVDRQSYRLTVPLSELILPEASIKRVTEEAPAPIQSPAPDMANLRYRKSVESLRFGLVPNEATEELTVGFENLRSWILSRFPKGPEWKESVSEVYGPYGSGKSHTMSLIRHLAKMHGFLSAHVEINGKDITLENPETLSTFLWKTLEGQSLKADTPLVNLFIKAIDRGNAAPTVAPRGIDRIKDNYNTIALLKRKGLLDLYGHDYESILSSATDIRANQLYRKLYREPSISSFDEPTVRKMIGRNVSDRPYDFIESCNGFAAIGRMAGYKGLVITIDEFEVQHWSKHWDRVESLISCLGKYLKGETGHERAPLAIFFASVGQEGHLGDIIIEYLLRECHGSAYPLEDFGEVEFMGLAKKIFGLYIKAYSLSAEFDIGEAHDSFVDVRHVDGHVRHFIKNYIACLDQKYGPQRPMET